MEKLLHLGRMGLYNAAGDEEQSQPKDRRTP